MAFDRADSGAHYRDHPFRLGDARGVLRAEIWEPYDHVESWDHEPLKALAAGLGLECVVLPSAAGMWMPGRTVPIVFYQRESNYWPNIEAGLAGILEELPRPS